MIDHIYCINMEKSRERRQKAQEQFESHGLDVEMFNATDGKTDAPDKILITPSEWGCAKSHVRVWRDIVAHGYETTLVFEDDVVLTPNFVEKLEKIMAELPDDWDFLNLGAPSFLRDDLRDRSENITEGKSFLMHAYLINIQCARKWSLIDVDQLRVALDTFTSNYPSINLHVKEPIALQGSDDSTIGILRTYDWTFLIQKWGILIVIILYILWRFL